MTETSKENNKALSNSNDKLIEKMTDKGHNAIIFFVSSV